MHNTNDGDLKKVHDLLVNNLQKINQLDTFIDNYRNEGKDTYDDWKDKYKWRNEQLKKCSNCAYCKKKMVMHPSYDIRDAWNPIYNAHPTIEHIMPKHYYPERTTDLYNLTVICNQCNMKKGASIVKGMRKLQARTKNRIKAKFKTLSPPKNI